MATFSPEVPVDPRCRSWSQRLLEALRSHNKAAARANLSVWNREFNLLLKDHRAARIDHVLAWYLSHMGEEFVPQAYSAAAFRLKFTAIIAAMSRTTPEVCEVSEADVGLAEKLTADCDVPTQVKAVLPTLVAQTRKNWLAFVDRMEVQLRKDHDAYNRRSVDHLNWILNTFGPLFVDVWLRQCCRQYGRSQWDKTTRWVFTPTSELFRDIWRSWSDHRTGNPCTFDQLLTDLTTEGKGHADGDR